MEIKVRPEFVTEDMLDFLDELRETGVTNMFGAAPYVHDEYPDLTKKESKDVLLYWMETFESRHPE
jgi:hypothetical protein